MQFVFVFLNFSRVSEVTLGPFVGFLCYVLCYVVGTKLMSTYDLSILPE